MRANSRLVAIAVLLLPSCFSQAPPSGAAQQLAEADRLKTENHFEQALAAYTTDRALAKDAGDLVAEASALQGIGDADYALGRYSSARQALAQSLALREQLSDSAGVGEVLNSVGNVVFAKGEYQEAKGYFERSLKLREQTGNRTGVAASWNNLGNTLQNMGRYLEAAEYLTRSAQAFEELGNQRYRGVVLNNLGILYGYLGDYDRALKTEGQGLEILRSLADNFRLATSLKNMGIIHNWMGNYRAALDELNQSLKLYQDLKIEWGAAENLNNIGLVYQSQSDHQQALAFFGKSLAANQKLGDKSLEAEGRLNVGIELLALGRVTESIREFDQSMSVSGSIGRKLLVSQARHALGRAHGRLGKTQEALHDFERAVAIQEEIGDRAGLADTTVELAALRLQLGDTPHALRLARSAAGKASEIPRPDTLWQAKLVSGKALRRAGRNQEAAADLDEAIATIEALRLQVAGTAAALPAYFGDRLEPYRERVLLDLAQGDTASALQHAERSKARALGEALRGGVPRLSRWMSEEEAQRERELENQLADLNIRAAKAPTGHPQEKPAELRNAVDNTRRELESFQATLSARHPELAIQRGAPEPLEIADIEAMAAASHAAILDYVVTRDTTYLFVAQPKGLLRVFPIRVSAAEVKKRAAEFRRQLASRDLGFPQMSGEMYRLLLAPAAAELAKYRAWIIIPDGALWDVAFQALQSHPGHYAIEDAAISYAPSLTLLRATLQKKQVWNGGDVQQLLAIGNPSASGAANLPDAERQVHALGKLYGEAQSSVLTGGAATEERFKSEASRYRVLHLAAHAVLDNASPLYSRVLLAKPSAQSSEDGLLEAREMMNLDLHAEMVVLSGCETASGQAAPGEGITGMLWAMFVAGAPATVASLWPVESASTSELMLEFHRQWLASAASGAPFRKAMAMRAAARKLIGNPQYAHPFYWAGFIVAGNPN